MINSTCKSYEEYIDLQQRINGFYTAYILHNKSVNKALLFTNILIQYKIMH